MRLLLLLIIVVFISTSGCKSDADLETFSEGMCICAEPIITWKAGFNKDPMSFGKGRAVQAEVDSCLNAYQKLFDKHENDSIFMEEVRAKVFQDCPKATGSVSAMLDLLKEK